MHSGWSTERPSRGLALLELLLLLLEVLLELLLLLELLELLLELLLLELLLLELLLVLCLHGGLQRHLALLLQAHLNTVAAEAQPAAECFKYQSASAAHQQLHLARLCQQPVVPQCPLWHITHHLRQALLLHRLLPLLGHLRPGGHDGQRIHRLGTAGGQQAAAAHCG